MPRATLRAWRGPSEPRASGWADDFLGCPYLKTSAEIANSSHPASQTIRDHLSEIGSYLEGRVAAEGLPDAARLGRELHALVAGSISLAAAYRSSAYALAGRDAAIQLLDAERAGGHRR